MVWVVVLLLIIGLLWNREGFEVPRLTQDAVIRDFRETIYQSNPRTPSREEVISYLSNLAIRPEEKEALVPILESTFKTADRETSQIKFTPDGTKIQPKMAAEEPIGSNAKHGDYETSDKDPVMPKSKVMSQTTPLNRDEVKPYNMNFTAFQQDSVPPQKLNPYVQKIAGMREHMSTMAGGMAQTNEIYGPRIPKQATSRTTDTILPLDSSKMYPMMFGPVGPGGTPGLPGAPAGPKGPGYTESVPIGKKDPTVVSGPDLSLMATPPYVEIPRLQTSTTKTEPVPFLNDFSKFYR